ncbi:MAG: helix-hairpin-helix domain-containing protein [Chitinophagales bacterium]|nr:helix-hairpin-helix domain-containing protein [Chitinophagales bacterium]
MKWYPFWKVWYFERKQRFAIAFIVLFCLLLLFIKAPVLNYFSKKTAEKYIAVSNQKWIELKSQIDSAKAIAKTEEIKNKKPNTYSNRKEKEYNQPLRFSKDENLILDINTSNVNDFKKLKGIGDVLSSRIISYRDKLGGFYSVNQISEVYGVSDSLFLALKKQFNLKSKKLKHLNINQAEFEELSTHPYISITLAKQIIGYRNKVKAFESVEEIKKMYAMTDTIYNKLLPYLTID